MSRKSVSNIFFFFQAEDGIRDLYVTGVQTCALPILVDGVAGNAAVDGADAAVAGTAGFAENDVFVFGITDLADGGVTILVNATDFTGGKANLRITLVAGHEGSSAAGAADHLCAAAGDDFDIVNGQADRNGAQGQAVADLWRSGWAAHEPGADLETAR